MTAGALADPVDDGACFGCGLENAIGLRMRFRTTADDAVECDVTVPGAYQGWRGVVHGGIVALLLDEGMAYAAATQGVRGVTASLSMRLRQPTPVDEPLVVRARVVWTRRSVIGVEASVAAADGRIFATAEGSFVAKGPLLPGQRLGEPRGS